MAIEFNDWKDLKKVSHAVEMKDTRIRNQEEGARSQRELSTRNPFLRGAAERADPARVGERPIVPQDRPRAPEPKTGPEVARHEDAKTRAEERYQEARGKMRVLSDTVYKSPRPVTSAGVGQETPQRAADQRVTARPEIKGQQGGTRVAEQAVKVAAEQVRTPVERDTAEKTHKKTRDAEGRLKEEAAVTKKDVREKKGAEGAGQDTDTAQGSLKGEAGRDVASRSGLIGGSTEYAKAEGREKGDGKRDAVSKLRDKKGGRASGPRPAYAGSREVEATMAELSSLLGGGSGDSSFGIEPAEGDIPAVHYEPAPWDIGGEIYTNDPRLSGFDQVYRAFVEYKQRTEKPAREGVAYENWDVQPRSIRERFIMETAQLVEVGQQLVQQIRRNINLAQGPRGFGTSC